MNKNIITNIIALLLTVIGYFFNQSLIFSIGIFALSGAFTNTVAIHMLFEKVPGLYGSGVIPTRFEEFKIAIKQLIMSQFFTQENIERFLSQSNNELSQLNLSPVISELDLTPAFNNLVNVIEESSFGGMLAMVGGKEALMPMKAPFIEKMKASMIEISQSEQFNTLLKRSIEQPSFAHDIQEKVENIIEKRLEELTPKLVKEMIQKIIKEHLGWLVVWGGVFGGLIGLLANLSNVW